MWQPDSGLDTETNCERASFPEGRWSDADHQTTQARGRDGLLNPKPPNKRT